MGTGRIKKNTLRAKMLGILMLCAMTSLLAAGIVSYMAVSYTHLTLPTN